MYTPYWAYKSYGTARAVYSCRGGWYGVRSVWS